MSIKEELLQILTENAGREISGQELADRLKVSRTAVWKAVNGLIAEGCEIQAGRNRGYRFISGGDLLSVGAVRAFLPPELQDNEIILLKTVDSTNTYAKKLAADGAWDGTVVIAEQQTAGRGRRGNSFYSPPGSGLYMSVILRPELHAADTDLFTICAGCAVSRAVERLSGTKPLIKWVNDVYLDGKKICGILSEATADFECGRVDSVVTGIGINISTKDFPDGLGSKAGSINAGNVTRARLAAEVLSELICCLERRRSDNIADYRARSLVLGKEVGFVLNNVQYIGKAIDIADSGELVVELEGGESVRLNSGEVSVTV
ncbi:MAG: biotin--[acetyl-CoA-carboxylase] ligase [Oscillospiraceae bacterium]|nr:biotin--[acetyl-CoA-carboxylase] ligase [Oscillospiraceae bacterium]